MKKLMFGAALAATGMAFAATYEGQVYDVTLSIKTTAAATATINNKTNPFLGEDKDLVVYRKQANATWKGLIWGCNCEAIDGVWEEAAQYGDFATIKGCILWDTKTKTPVFVGDGSNLTDAESAQGCGFGWEFLNAIDKNGKKVEGAWTMTQDGKACEDTESEYEGTLFEFTGAGFGSLQLNTTDGSVDCSSYVKSISGNFAGWMKAPNASTDDDWSGCTFCGYDPVYGECEFATAWEYCDCDDDGYLKEEVTAAYGTWSVKYNASTSKKLSAKATSVDETGAVTIRMAYNFKSLPKVAAAILAIENTFWEIDPTGCDDLEAALNTAKTALKEANAAAEEVSDETLLANYKEAKADYDDALTNKTAALATTNLFGNGELWTGVKLGYKTTREIADPVHGTYKYVTTLDFDKTCAANLNEYGNENGTTNKLLVATRAQKEAYGAVNSNEYYISYRVKIGSADTVVKYGSKALAAYVADQYAKVSGSTNIEILASTVAPAQGEGASPRSYADEFTAETKNKVNAWAEDDAAWLVKANTALEKAQDANAAATAAFKAVFDEIFADAEAVETATTQWDNRVDLQKEAAAKVTVAEAAVTKAEKDLEDAGCND